MNNLTKIKSLITEQVNLKKDNKHLDGDGKKKWDSNQKELTGFKNVDPINYLLALNELSQEGLGNECK